jgi:cytochrome subunit of sulfide dehydrogenase
MAPFPTVRPRRAAPWGLVALLAVVASASAPAAPTVPAGRLLASNCFQCHGTNGRGPGFETIAGQSAQETYEKLKAFQSGHEGTGIMAKHSLGYTDEQLRLLSQYLANPR